MTFIVEYNFWMQRKKTCWPRTLCFFTSISFWTCDHTPPWRAPCRHKVEQAHCPIDVWCCCDFNIAWIGRDRFERPKFIAMRRCLFYGDSLVKIRNCTCNVNPLLSANVCPAFVCWPYSTVPVVRPRPRLPVWTAGPTACLPTLGQSLTYDLCLFAIPHRSAAPTSSPLRPQCCPRSTAHPTPRCTVPARIGTKKPLSSR